MKTKILYFVPILLGLLAGCANHDIPVPTGPVPSSGTFTGTFKLYHITYPGVVVRTDSTNLNLTMETATGFKITGDTTTLHAGSYGSYEVNASGAQLLFFDKTFPPDGTIPAKVHLDGTYSYQYDGATLQLLAYGPMDTLQYYYKLTRTGN